MNIVCEKCNTVYRFDASKIPPGGKKVKCSHCQHIFMARPVTEEVALRTLDPDTDQDPELAEPDLGLGEAEGQAGKKDGEGDKRKQRLLLRQEGTRYAVADLATLQRWIVERRVTREAELSMDGEVWEKVAERMDLLPFFSIVDKSKSKKKIRKDGSSEGPMPDVKQSPQDSAQAAAALQAAAGEVAEAVAAGVQLDPALQAATQPSTSRGSSASAHSSRAGGAQSATGGEPVSGALNQLSPAAAGGYGAAGGAVAATTSSGNSSSAATAIYAIAALVLLGGLGYVVKTRVLSSSEPMTEVAGSGNQTSGAPGQPGDPSSSGASIASPGDVSVASGGAGTGGNAPEIAPAGTAAGVGVGPSDQPGSVPVAPTPERVSRPEPTPVAVVATPKPAVAVQTPKPAQAREPEPARTPEPRAVATKTAPAEVRGSPVVAPGGSANSYLKAGRDAINRHKYDLAVANYKKARDLAPNNAMVYKEMAQALLNLAEEDYARQGALRNEAVEACRKAISINPKYAEAYHLLGVTNLALNQKGEAARNLRQALNFGLKGDDATEVRSFLNQLEGEGGSN